MYSPAANVQPKFLFGVDGNVTNNLHFLDHNTVIYPCGHNIVIYRTDEKSQRFIPGLEGSEGITAMALSSNKKTLAVCEKSSKAIVSLYNVGKILEYVKEEVRYKKTTNLY
jgi:hypothetical protein